ncbi:MAG: HAD family hydrolase [bacterium]|nr:HAD family hydrolase [bacterium]
MYKYILFDWDGCLAKTLHLWMKAYTVSYQEAGINTTPKEILIKSWGNNELGPKNYGIENYLDFFNTKVVSYVQNNIQSLELYKYTKEILLNLKKQNKILILVTSSPRNLITPALKNHNLTKVFDFTITDSEVTHRKPNPEIIEVSLKEINGNKNEAIIIGDTEKDILAGKNAEIASILVLHEENRIFYDFEKVKQTNPDYIVYNLKELLNIV